MEFAQGQVGINAIARQRQHLATQGVELTDLTDTNPTRHGLFDPEVLDVIGRHLARAGRYEPRPRGPWPARAALAERFGGDPDDYWLTASTSEAYGWLFALLVGPGQAVAIPSPGYPLIEPLAGWQGVTTRDYRTFYVHPSGWEVDHDDLRQVVADPVVRALVVVNPNNPTGAYAETDLGEVAARRGLPLIADEVFFPFQLAAPPRAPVRLSGGEATLTIGLDGLSKLLAAPQLKLGWLRLSGPARDKRAAAELLDQIADSYLSVNSLVALALPDLLALADRTLSRVTRRLRDNLEVARQLLAAWRLRTVYGGWMLLVDVPPAMSAEALIIALMATAGLSAHPGYFYDLPDQTLAISLLPEPAVFRESMERLAAGLTVLGDPTGQLGGPAGGTTVWGGLTW
jgi:aspartate/methionine/tyrosine aminotransferase